MIEKNVEEKMSELIRIFYELPEEGQYTFRVAMKSFPVIAKICADPGMTREEMEEMIERAKREGDYMIVFMICLARFYLEGK